MSYIQFRLAARTDAAGKYNESAPLEGNEDNMFVDFDLDNPVQGLFTADKVVDLSEKGCLMVVADGMGGMNAGEVASAIAIKTVMDYFSPARISQMTFSNAQARIKYMEEVVVASDAAIKADAQNNSEHEGMGSTLIMAWLCDGQVCITWCGDSRAYLFRPAVGFRQVSKDHSYVQSLVDEGKITEAEAFDHPYGNIITRSLGDPEKKAEPDSICFNVYEGDIIMLCSDGLSGVLRDHKTIINGERVDTENLEDLIRDNRASMAECRDELFAAAERNDWYDNVTAILCEIVKGDPLPVSQAQPAPQASPAEPQVTYAPMPDPSATLGKKRSKALIPIIAAAVLLLGLAAFLVWKFAIHKGPNQEEVFFAKCQKSNKIELYRSYLELYPQGKFIEEANVWIKHYEDSIAQVHLTLDESAKSDTQSEDVTEEKKAEKEKAKVEEKKEEKQTKVAEKEGEEERREKNLENTGDVVKEKEFTKETDLKKISEEHPAGFTPVLSQDTPDEFTPDGLKKETKKETKNETKKKGEMTEEEMAKNANTFEDCYAYVEKYGNKGPHISTIRGKFQQLYAKKLGKCITKSDYEKFLKEHDGIMKKMRLDGSQDDKNWRSRVEKKINEFKDEGNQKGLNESGDSQRGIIQQRKIDLENKKQKL